MANRFLWALSSFLFVLGCNDNSPSAVSEVDGDSSSEVPLESAVAAKALGVSYEAPSNSLLMADLKSEGDGVVYEIVSQPANGKVYLESDGGAGFVYEPNECFSGEDEFRFKAANLLGSSLAVSKIDVRINAESGLGYALPLLNLPEISHYLGRFSIASFSNGRVVFSDLEGDVRDDVLYDRREDNFNYDGLYEVKDLDGDVSYFRFGWQTYRDSVTKFHYVKWVNGKSPNLSSGVFDVSVAAKDICRSGGKDVTIVGDSITWWSNGQYLRRLLHQKNSSLNFTGSRTDVFGYGHEGEGGDNSQEIINRIDGIVVSDVYILMVGTNDRYKDVSDTVENIQEIVRGLMEKSSESIVYVATILPRNDSQDLAVVEINNLIREWFVFNQDQRVRMLDLGMGFRELEGWQDLLPDGLHPSLDGYRDLSQLMFSGMSSL